MKISSKCPTSAIASPHVKYVKGFKAKPTWVTVEEKLSEQRLVLVVPYALALVAAVGALRSRRTAPAKVTGKEG